MPPSCQHCFEDLTDPSATISEGDGNNEEDAAAANVQRSGRLERGISSAVMDEEAQFSPAISTGPPERPTHTIRHAGDSMVRRIGLSVEHRSAPGRAVDTPQLQALVEDLADPSATISEGEGNNEEDMAPCLASRNEPPAKRQQRVDWQEMSRFQSKEQWQQCFGNEEQFVLYNIGILPRVF